jgi:tRNA(Ile)-lysidine synthetase-like protein
MKVDIIPDKYVVAVSGGVDSMVLLDILSKKPGISLVIAHFNHGIREDSGEDEKLVGSTAKKLKIPYEVGNGNLGPKTSEDIARRARYSFLGSVKDKSNAGGVITAHHQDDLIETAMLNMLRGSGHRGLVSMKLNINVVRPLLKYSKKDILDYAQKHEIKWREDKTNDDDKYLRNYLRKRILPGMSDAQKRDLLSNIDKVESISTEKDRLIAILSHNISEEREIKRGKYILLPQNVRQELLLFWLRRDGVSQFDRKTVEKIDISLKTGLPGTKIAIKDGYWLKLGHNTARFESRT